MAYHFNNRIKVYKEVVDQSPIPGASGEEIIGRPWADIKTLKGSEYNYEGVIASEQPTRFIIRYREGIDTTQRIKWGNRDYNIHSVTNDDGRNQTLTIFAKAFS
ncbi:phage head closure protein [Staphylococcus equorum]|uniref:phage head closure protein n=1 Tax=Staphylococcus equorum TaxID=246432 RepID=UPI0025563BCF|nr:phage head closure protein [Staphylococcus equorum]MDK9854340.1 phage head closure protein [Staphylococcus equorum]